MTDNIKEDVYTEEGLEEEVEDDEIRDSEEGFIEGYEGNEDVNCANCGKVLGDEEDVVEEEFDNKIRRFCSNRCAENFEKKKK